jgi:pre-mRNA-splicing factor ATP-dependent RNA helicase DHX15/PRP43
MKDILDKNGKNLNFLNNLPYTDNYIKLAQFWSKLPIYTDEKNVNTFFNLLNEKQVILLSSGTGSGKTVIIPKFLLKYIINNNINGMIAITNPKILTTYSNAEYGALTLDVKLGEEVGYKYKGSPSNSTSDKTRLLYLTDGLLFAQISNDKYLEKYAGVIIDEAHERNIQIDLLLKLLKDVVLHRKDFKLIIMSATINSEVFRDYFNIENIKYGEIYISGTPNYPINQHWAIKSIKAKDYMKQILETCNKILKSKNPQDIIVFIPTQKDAYAGCNLIKSNNIYCVEMFSKMSNENKELAVSKDLYKKSGYKTKIIFATNVAESSITFDGLVYVIDTGLELIKEYDPYYNMDIIKKDFTSQAQIIQRIGRTGRTSPGEAYHLYTKELFNNLPKYPRPNILTTDLTEIILSLIKYSITIKNTMILVNNLITTPSELQINAALHKLKFCKCLKIDDDNGVLSRVGLSIIKFRSTNLLSALAIIMSYYLNCQDEMIIIMAIMEITEGNLNQLFSYNDDKQCIKYITKYSYTNSDHLTVYNVYTKLYKNNKMKYLNLQIFNKIDNYVKDLQKYAKIIRIKDYDYMNYKYFMINIKPFINIEDNIIYILSKSYQYNLIKNNTTINFINQTKAKFEFAKCTKHNKKINTAICHNLINRFGKKVFIGISLI